MAIKNIFPKAIIFFLLIIPPIAAQDTTYFVERRFVQRLSWSGDEYALHYEVLIEREEAGAYRPHESVTTEAFFIDISLPPGRYRYHVVPYNLLGRPGERTAWVLFEVLPALVPDLSGLAPSSVVKNELPVFELYLYGNNLVQGAEFSLRRLDSDDAPIYPYQITITQNGTRANLMFHNNRIDPGIYEVHVRNPGGMETTRRRLTVTPAVVVAPIIIEEPVTPEEAPIEDPPIEDPPIEEPPIEEEPIIEEAPPIEEEIVEETAEQPIEEEPIVQEEPKAGEPVLVEERARRERTPRERPPKEPIDWGIDWFLTMAWMPTAPVVGDMPLEKQFMYPVGFIGRLGILFTGWSVFSIGAEAALGWNSLEASYDGYDLSQRTFSAEFNLLLQKRFLRDRIAFTFRGGAGFAKFSGTSYLPSGSQTLNEGGLQMVFGLSFQFMFTRIFYVETGIDYAQYRLDSPSGSIRPWIGLGGRI